MASAETLARAQEAAEARVGYLEEMLIDGESELPAVEEIQPYCGCTICQVRETIAAVTPILTGHAIDCDMDDDCTCQT